MFAYLYYLQHTHPPGMGGSDEPVERFPMRNGHTELEDGGISVNSQQGTHRTSQCTGHVEQGN